MKFISIKYSNFLFLIVLLFTGNIYTQELKFKAYVNTNNIKFGDYLIYTVETDQRVNFKEPAFYYFNVVQGPNTSSSSYTSIINGKRDEVNTYKTTYYLKPKKQGSLAIEQATTEYKGRIYKTKSIQVNVRKGSSNQQSNTSNSNSNNNKNSNLFAEIKLTKTRAYIGENILATYKIYTRYNRMQIIDYDFPMTNGLWTEDIKSGGNGWPQKQEVRNGMVYNVLTLKKEIISPQKSGKITIAPIEIKALFNQSFFNPGTEYSFKSNSVTIQVKSFPKGAPLSFTDQVGKNYKLNVEYSTKELKVDDPLDISISISGNGNLKQLVIPELKYPKDLEIFPVETKEEFKINTSGVFGKKTHHQLLIPRHHGTYTIPEIIFSYFDLNSKKYRTIKYPSQKIIVEKNNSTTSSNTNSTIINQEDVRLMNESIRYIETQSDIFAKRPTLYGTKKYWAFLASPGILFFLFILLYNYKKRNSNPEKIAQKKAGRNLEKKFSLAGTLLSNQQIDEFYEELYKAWLQYISIKFKLPVSKLNKESIKNVCIKCQISEQDISSLENILDQCEKAKYAPLDVEDSKAVLQESKIIIQKIEKHAKV